jgi:phosphate/sulfate permease
VNLESFLLIAMIMGLGMLIWDCLEVGRNDAANLVNAVFGARVMKRRTAVLFAGAAVILGAVASSPVIETARKGIFDPGVMTFQMAMAIYVSVYFVDTVLLYGFSGFGMPVSTTACLVFELVGASLFLAGFDVVKWEKVGEVVSGIFVSILVSGIAAFLIMRVFRGAIREKSQERETVLIHGPWVAGLMLTWLSWFMIFKGLKNMAFVTALREGTFGEYGVALVLLVMWGLFTLLTHLVLTVTGERGTRYLFHATAVLGMVCMAFAFGQNDLANAASPGLSAFWLWQHRAETTAVASGVEIAKWALLICGALMAGGMFTQYAQRVTRAEVNTGSQFDHVALYAPDWCRALARVFLRVRGRPEALAPPPSTTERGKKIHYDTLRASVITAVSASVIAFASGRGLPVSTTYVAFAAVVGTGFSDRVFARGDADRKIGRAIWVVTCWLLAPLIAIIATGLVARLVFHLTTIGLFLGLALNLGVRVILKRRSDAHEKRYHIDVAAKEEEERGEQLHLEFAKPEPSTGSDGGAG